MPAKEYTAEFESFRFVFKHIEPEESRYAGVLGSVRSRT